MDTPFTWIEKLPSYFLYLIHKLVKEVCVTYIIRGEASRCGPNHLLFSLRWEHWYFLIIFLVVVVMRVPLSISFVGRWLFSVVTHDCYFYWSHIRTGSTRTAKRNTVWSGERNTCLRNIKFSTNTHVAVVLSNSFTTALHDITFNIDSFMQREEGLI